MSNLPGLDVRCEHVSYRWILSLHLWLPVVEHLACHPSSHLKMEQKHKSAEEFAGECLDLRSSQGPRRAVAPIQLGPEQRQRAARDAD